MLAWVSMAERQKRWDAFVVDPEWTEITAESEKDGRLVENIKNQFLIPTAFSAVT
jgi:hypothetical protein